MNTLTVANQKGGVGKTSIVFHLALYFAKVGKRCLVLDLDQQANASYSLKKYDGIEIAPFTSCDLLSGSIANVERLDFTQNQSASVPPPGPYIAVATPDLIEIESRDLREVSRTFLTNKAIINTHAKPGFDYILIDTAPSMAVKMAAALMISDYVLSPIELETFAVNGLSTMLMTITNMQAANKNLKFLGLVPNKLRHERQYNSLQALKNAYADYVIPCPIGERDSISDAVSNGIPVWRIQKTAARKAAKEVMALGQYVLESLEKTDGKKTRRT
jgi:chromosome partitioning protein